MNRNQRLIKHTITDFPGASKSITNLPKERWAGVPGLEETHQVSNYGRFRALDKVILSPTQAPYVKKGRIMSVHIAASPNHHTGDYTYHASVNVETKERTYTFSIRRLVYHCFVEPIVIHEGFSPEYIIVPKDGNGRNNWYKNLRKLTKAEYEHLLYQQDRFPNTFKTLSRAQRQRIAQQAAVKKYKPVTQYDTKGHRVAQFASLTEASTYSGARVSSIGNAAKGRILTAGGFLWRLGSGPKKIPVQRLLHQRMESYLRAVSKPIVQRTAEGKLIQRYASIREAVRQTGYNKSTLSACINGRLKTAYGFVWKAVCP